MAGVPAVLAVDAGSSRLRASLVALRDGAVIDSRLAPALPLGAELDVGALWRDLVAIAGELDRTQADISAIAVAAQLGMVLLDDRGRPARPALGWGDKRARREAEQLSDLLPPETLASAGRPISAELTIARLRWLATHEPTTLRRARWVVSIKDALIHRLTGRAVTDETNASYTGLFDVYNRAWAPALVEAAGIEAALLPPARPGAAVAGTLTDEAAAALGLPRGLAVAVGGPDGTVGAIGAGAVHAGVTVDVAGTTDVLLHTIDRPLADPPHGTVLNAHLAPSLWTAGGPTGLTGGVVQWTASLLGFGSVDDAHRALGETAAHSSEGPIFLTTLDGSRFPTWRPERTGLIAALRPEHGPADVFLAAQQGVAFTVGAGLDALRTRGLQINEVIVVGGAAARPATLQLRSDAWAVSVVALANREATTIGAAMLAGVAGGAFPDLDRAARALVRPVHRYEPRPQAAPAMAAARRRWQAAEQRHAST